MALVILNLIVPNNFEQTIYQGRTATDEMYGRVKVGSQLVVSGHRETGLLSIVLDPHASNNQDIVEQIPLIVNVTLRQEMECRGGNDSESEA
jgi:hypothetical protein